MAATIEMFDSVNADHVPAGAKAYAGYVNGRPGWRSYGPMRARFPAVRVHGIDVLGNAPRAAGILDYEPGDVQSPAGAAAWCRERNAFRPYTAVVYSDRSELAELEAGLAGVWHYLWVATLDGTDLTGTHHPANGTLIVATQLWDRGPYDESSALEFWAAV